MQPRVKGEQKVWGEMHEGEFLGALQFALISHE
jgi:hypothetical protein